MAKLLVKDSKTGNVRPMTQKSFDTAGKKRGFVIVGKEAETGEKSEIQQHMDRLRAEKAARLAAEAETEQEESADESAEPEVKERKKPGPKPKNPAA
jgi:hypothetical protein